jgi:hypothetical protein
MPLAGFELTIPKFERAEAFHPLDRAATVTGSEEYTSSILRADVKKAKIFTFSC